MKLTDAQIFERIRCDDNVYAHLDALIKTVQNSGQDYEYVSAKDLIDAIGYADYKLRHHEEEPEGLDQDEEHA